MWGGAISLSGDATAQGLSQVLGFPITRDLDSPCFIASWPGNSKILVVVERGSRKITAWVPVGNGLQDVIVADLSTQAHLPASFGEFIGVTAFAFHPEFLKDPAKRFFYVRFNAPVPSPTTFIERWTIAPGSLKVTPSTQTAIYSYPTTATGHGSGTIHFDTRKTGPNLLYVPMPDDTSNGWSAQSCCEATRAQDAGGPSDIGHLLTIEVDATPPLVSKVAKGLRNPFGFSVDRGKTSTGEGLGDVWIGDAGFMDTGSIIKRSPFDAYTNYGWPWRTGDGSIQWSGQPQISQTACGMMADNPPLNCGEPAGMSYDLPYSVFSDIFEFGGSSDVLIGGYVYRQATVPALANHYVFATYGNGRTPRVYKLSASPGGGVQAFHVSTFGMSAWPLTDRIHALGQDASGQLYVVRVDQSTNSQVSNGIVYLVKP